jgi:hypothetical protein
MHFAYHHGGQQLVFKPMALSNLGLTLNGTPLTNVEKQLNGH